MGVQSLKRQPTFAWQALLILLPVIVLATFGFLSLREDRKLARSEAVERAQVLADDLVVQFWSALRQEQVKLEVERHPTFCVDSTGQLLHPSPIPPWPIPAPLNSAELSSAQAQLWQEAQVADTQQANPLPGIKAFRAFLGLEPPNRFAAAAHYSLGLLLSRSGETEAAAQTFTTLLEQFPEATGESGFPLQTFARLKLLQLETNSQLYEREALESYCSNI